MKSNCLLRKFPMKQLDETFWANQRGDSIGVGFTSQGLINLGQIWNFIPRVRVGDRVFHGQAIATIESTNSVKSLCIPIDGILVSINEDAIDFPESITEDIEVFVFTKVSHALLGL